jgi:hypothetical protein
VVVSSSPTATAAAPTKSQLMLQNRLSATGSLKIFKTTNKATPGENNQPGRRFQQNQDST